MFGAKSAFEAWRGTMLEALLADGVADPTEAQIPKIRRRVGRRGRRERVGERGALRARPTG